MTPEEEATAAAVTAKLLGRTGVFDHEATQAREFWKAGRLTHARPKAGCDNTFYRMWGEYPDYTDDS